MNAETLAQARARALSACRAAGASPEDAEDSAQDAVADLLARGSESARIGNLDGWVTVVSRRRLADRWRTGRRERLALARLLATTQHGVDPAERVADRDQARWLVHSLNRMPPHTQQVCAAAGDGGTVRQIADELGITVRAAESHLTRARRTLRGLTLLGVSVGVVWRAVFSRRWPLTTAAPVLAAFAIPALFLLPMLVSPGNAVTEAISGTPNLHTAIPPLPDPSTRQQPAPPADAPGTSASAATIPALSSTPVRQSPTALPVVPGAPVPGGGDSLVPATPSLPPLPGPPPLPAPGTGVPPRLPDAAMLPLVGDPATLLRTAVPSLADLIPALTAAGM